MEKIKIEYNNKEIEVGVNNPTYSMAIEMRKFKIELAKKYKDIKENEEDLEKINDMLEELTEKKLHFILKQIVSEEIKSIDELKNVSIDDINKISEMIFDKIDMDKDLGFMKSSQR